MKAESYRRWLRKMRLEAYERGDWSAGIAYAAALRQFERVPV